MSWNWKQWTGLRRGIAAMMTAAILLPMGVPMASALADVTLRPTEEQVASAPPQEEVTPAPQNVTILGEDGTAPDSAWTMDTETKGAWTEKYGQDGYVLCGWDNQKDLLQLPDYISSVTYTAEDRNGGWVARSGETAEGNSWWDYGLPDKADPDGTRKVAYHFDDKKLTVNITATDDEVHQITLYAVAENQQNRRQSVQLFRAGTDVALTDAVEMTNLMEGKYVTACFTGSVDVVIDNLNYNPLHTNSLVSGIFFDQAPENPVQVESVSVATADGKTSYPLNQESIEVQMTASVLPMAAANKNVSWSVEPSDGASVDENGVLTVTKGGTYTVTATAVDGSNASGSVELTVTETAHLPAWTVDTETKGAWTDVYGQDGYVLCGWDNANDLQQLPYYIDSIQYITEDRSGGYVARKADSAQSNDWWEDALPDKGDPDGTRKIAYRFDDKRQTVRITANDTDEHQLTFYCLAEADGGRQQTVQMFDPATGEPISQTVTMQSLDQGKYITVNFTGSVDVVFNNDNYKPLYTNTVINGIFFDTHYDGQIPVRRISVAPEDGEIIRTQQGTVQMTAATWPQNAAQQDITWSVTEGSDVASVDTNGLVTIHKNGAFTVRAEASNTGIDGFDAVFDQVSMVCLEGMTVPEAAEIQSEGLGSFVMIQNPYVRLIFDKSSGYYSVYDQSNGMPQVLNAYFQVNDAKSIDGYTFTFTDTTGDAQNHKSMRLVGEKDGTYGIVLDVTLEDNTGDIMMKAGIQNTTSEGVKVMQMYPMVARYQDKGGIFVGPNPGEDHTVLTGEGNWTVPQVKQTVNTTLNNNLIVSYRNNPELENFLIGQLTTYSFQSTITTHYDADAAIENNGRSSMDADIRIYDNTGKLVDADDTYVGDTALLNFTQDNPYDSLDEFATRQADAMDVQLMDFDPYIYECLWYVNWFEGDANNADFAVQEVKDLYEKGMANYARPNLRVEPDTYVNPNEQLWWDDEHWKAFGHLTDTYPTMKEWIAAMQAAGGEGGTYMQASYRSDDYCEQYPEQMYYNDSRYAADYTDPEFQEHMKEVYTNLKDAGIRSIFYDYAGQYHGPSFGYLLDQTGGFEDEHATAVEAYRMIFELPKKYIGRDVRITENSWEYSGSDVAIGLIDIQRNIHDTNAYSPEIAQAAINQWYRHRKTKLLYPDTKVFEEENLDLRRAQITGTGFFFGKTTLGESVNRMSESKIQDVGKIVPFPIDGITARPVGLLESEEYKINPYVYDYKFASDYDDHIVMFWNQDGEGARTISVDMGLDTAFGGLGLDPEKEYEVWDFWDWKYIGRFQGSDELTQLVRDQEMKTMAVREVRDEPYLISTNRHVLQGTKEIDVKEFSYDPATRTITGTFSIVGNDTYKAIIGLADNQLVVDSFTVDNDQVTASYAQNAANNYVQLTLDAEENQDVPFTLVLKEGVPEADTQAPSAITGLTATADNNGIVTLNWDASTDDSAFVEYLVYGSDDPNFTPDDSNLLLVVPRNTYTAEEIRQGDYYYKVVARDSSGNTTEPATVKTNVSVIAVPSDKLSATAGDAQKGQEADKALDGNESTLWHTSWAPNEADREDMWLNIHMEDGAVVDTLRYLPRSDKNNEGTVQLNGTIIDYRVEGSKDNGASYTTLAEGTFSEGTGWKEVAFAEDTYTDIRLVAVTSHGEFASAAEVQVLNMSPITSIAMRDEQVTLNPQEQVKLMVDVYPTNFQGTAVTFTSDNEAVATVDENGMVIGVATGTATITATVGELSTSCTVTVVPKETANKTLLQKTYDYALTLSTDGVTDTAKAAFEAALANAKKVLEDETATQAQVNAAWDALLEGIWGLGLVQGDKTMLEQLIAKADDMVANADKYMTDNWQQLVDALAKAKDVYADGDAMDQDIQPVAEDLISAILAQRFKADKSILEDLIGKAEGMDLTGYTAQSVEVFRTALAQAQAVLADETLTEDDQATVDAAVEQLTRAMDGLTAEGTPEATDKPETTDKPEVTDKPQATQKPGQGNVPQTGDHSQITLWVTLMGLCAASALILVAVKGRSKAK